MLSNAPTIDEADRASSRGASTWPTTRRRLREHRTALAIAIVLATLAGLALWRWNRDVLTSPVAAEPATVAVLPLTNGSGDARDDAFAVGLTEGLATRLSALKNVRVLSLDESRDAAKSGLDAARAARTLGAAFVVEGRIQRNQETLEVDVDLVRSDGQRASAGHFTGTPGAAVLAASSGRRGPDGGAGPAGSRRSHVPAGSPAADHEPGGVCGLLAGTPVSRAPRCAGQSPARRPPVSERGRQGQPIRTRVCRPGPDLLGALPGDRRTTVDRQGHRGDPGRAAHRSRSAGGPAFSRRDVSGHGQAP